MAIKSTIFKAALQITDMDRHYYRDHQLTIARHPSENDERMMVRLLAFALHAGPALQLCRGISDEDEPDLWQKSLNGDIELWIDLGQPDEKRIRKACGRAAKVVIYTYQPRSADVWWKQQADRLKRFDKLEVRALDETGVAQLGRLAQRSMQLQCTIQDGHILMTNGVDSAEITPLTRQASGA